MRYKGEKSLLFVLNHNHTETDWVMEEDRTELLTGVQYKAGQRIAMKPKDVMILEK